MEIKGSVMQEQEDQSIKLKKITLLVEGDSFAEMEAIGMEWLNSTTMYTENTIIDGVKRVGYAGVKVNDTLSIEVNQLHGLTQYTPESEDGSFFELQVHFEEEGANGKPKIIKDKFVVPALSQKEAIIKLEGYLQTSMLPWKIPSGKELDVYACLVLNETYQLSQMEDDLMTGNPTATEKTPEGPGDSMMSNQTNPWDKKPMAKVTGAADEGISQNTEFED